MHLLNSQSLVAQRKPSKTCKTPRAISKSKWPTASPSSHKLNQNLISLQPRELTINSSQWDNQRKVGQAMNVSSVDNLGIGPVHAPCAVNNKSHNSSRRPHSPPMLVHSVADPPTVVAKVHLSVVARLHLSADHHHSAKAVVAANAIIAINSAIGLVTVLKHQSLIKEEPPEVEEVVMEVEMEMDKDFIDFNMICK